VVIEIVLAFLAVCLVALAGTVIGPARRKESPTRLPPGFTVVERRAGAGGSPPAGRGRSPDATGFTFTISANPTAICRLTGRPVQDCGCEKHQGRNTS
jgi:hypothetical protein